MTFFIKAVVVLALWAVIGSKRCFHGLVGDLVIVLL